MTNYMNPEAHPESFDPINWPRTFAVASVAFTAFILLAVLW